ncbi:hypothetical protein [Flavobacterium hercynium]|uniref:Peptidase M50 domain-containing protein n=1 Tax=Flavobacterium hercynium TaxID=387094 RepID=A0A226HJ64_9FLAO|nr:hypothetical protein [Flavobacterium hercynium]OXA93500.1 hypothetical protein B0A66_06630 [Flavobacterium hercynium]SMP32044.1 hypothetical protein SAMN06265346_114112 [Flavobacterium hercynium]
MIEKNTNSINLKYIFLVFVAVFLSTISHELAHWGMGQFLGNKMTVSLNTANPISGSYLQEWHRNYITLAGPLFTVLQAILCYFLIVRYKRIEIYPFLFFPLVMRFAAGLINLKSPNDEGRLGLSLGIGLLTISIFVCLFLFVLVRNATKELKINWKLNMLSFILCCLFLLLLTFIDAKFKIKLI